MYHALMKHLEQYPEQRHRFPGLETGRKVILTRGCSGPIAGEKYSVEDFHGRYVTVPATAALVQRHSFSRDGLGDIAERHPDLNAEAPTTEYPHLLLTDRPGVEVALDIIRNGPSRSITYIALGPLTNLAQLLRLGGDTVRNRIGRVVCMGGALDVPGNTTPAAECEYVAQHRF